MNHSISIFNAEIRIYDGLYSLNDIHRAAGCGAGRRPPRFLRTKRAQALIEEIENSSAKRRKAVVILKGHNSGTYACEELAYAYAMWVSVEYHLAVLRAFGALLGAPAGGGGGLTVLMTIEGDPAKSPESIHTILPRWRVVPMRDLGTLTRLVLDGLGASKNVRY